jgi:hypothetical protein
MSFDKIKEIEKDLKHQVEKAIKQPYWKIIVNLKFESNSFEVSIIPNSMTFKDISPTPKFTFYFQNGSNISAVSNLDKVKSKNSYIMNIRLKRVMYDALDDLMVDIARNDSKYNDYIKDSTAQYILSMKEI